jgi:hypothetical protein
MGLGGLPPTVLDRLQGVWFPTHLSQDGRLTAVHEPAVPAPPGVWLLTIRDDTFHATANGAYYASGGRVRLGPEPGRLTFAYAGLPAEYHQRFAYRLAGSVLVMQSGGLPWSQPSDWVMAVRYVRVAAGPTPEMLALIETVMRGAEWEL